MGTATITVLEWLPKNHKNTQKIYKKKFAIPKWFDYKSTWILWDHEILGHPLKKIDLKSFVALLFMLSKSRIRYSSITIATRSS